METFYGFVFGMIIGLVAATVIATLMAEPTVTYQQFTLEGKEYDCVLWRGHAVCDPATPKLSLREGP